MDQSGVSRPTNTATDTNADTNSDTDADAGFSAQELLQATALKCKY